MGELTFKVVSMMGWSAATAIRMAKRYRQTESYPETGFWEVGIASSPKLALI